jgi:ATP phosphoribosyltransferase regulatory subunit
MKASVTTQTHSPDARAEALVASYERAGYVRVAPAMLQPAEPFLDLSGEDIRRRMYLTTAPDGRELCLRPDLTIPVSRDYLASPSAGKPAGFCYLGPVFRHRSDAPAEFLQAGIESFGRADKAAADAEMLRQRTFGGRRVPGGRRPRSISPASSSRTRSYRRRSRSSGASASGFADMRP